MKMVKYILIGVVVLAVIGIAGFALASNQNSSDQDISSTNPSGTVAQEDSQENVMQSQTLTGTIFDLLARGTSLECTFETTDDYGTTSGTVYISGNNVRGDFELISSESSTESYSGSMIRGDEYTYIWSSLEDTGMKLENIDPDELGEVADGDDTEKPTSNFSLEDLDAEYECAKWSVDQNMFKPPSDMEFVDFSAQMEEIGEALQEQTGVDCSICDELPQGDVQTQCRSSLGC